MTKKMKTIPITEDNYIYAQAELDFTHDHSTVKVDSIMYDRNGTAHIVSKIDKDDCGRRRFWSGAVCLCVQYNSPHNMLTKSPFYAHEFKIS